MQLLLGVEASGMTMVSDARVAGGPSDVREQHDEWLGVTPEARAIGRSCLRVFPIAYGCWRFAGTSVAEARAKVEAALSAGIQLFDHGDIYGGGGAAEELFGRVLRDAPALRRYMVISTKCGVVPGIPYNASKRHLVTAVETSLRRLHCEVIDLFFVHRYDFLAHPEETARALETLRQAGKVREVGVSNYTSDQCETLQSFLPFPLVAHQREWSLVWPAVLQDGTVEQCFRRGMSLIAWSPLAGGKLAVPRQRAETDKIATALVPVVDTLQQLAERNGVDRSAVALAFLLVHPVGAIPIIGTQRPERIQEVGQVFQVRLRRSEWYTLLQAGLGKKLP